MALATENFAVSRPRTPVALRAIATGLLVGLPAANVWPLLLGTLGMPRAAGIEALLLGLYIWWARGNGYPASWRAVRRTSFRKVTLSRGQWPWAIMGAIALATTIHAAIVVLFRLVPFPVEQFREGYHFAVQGLDMKWLAIVMSAASAGICEETGFRGYIQQPIEKRHGAFVAIAISSLLFTAVHLSKGWALPGMVPIVLLAGVLLGLMAWAADSLVPTMIGHTIMDIGLFAYWWTGTAGTFSMQTIAATGVDAPFIAAVAIAVAALATTLTAVVKLRRGRAA
jgi:membrane protease YdiL (CAAX protease family)